MNEKRKEEIIEATLKLASEKGLKAVSMSMIASEIGIKKPSLYNHFRSKEELVSEMYGFLRNKSKDFANVKNINYELLFKTKSAPEILKTMVHSYEKMCSCKETEMFYKVVYAERTTSRESAKILTTESETMINQTKKTFSIFQKNNLLSFKNIEISATSFALTIHAMMDFEADKSFSETGKIERDFETIDTFIDLFCEEHKE